MGLGHGVDPGERGVIEAEAAGQLGEVAGLLTAPLSTFLRQLGDVVTAFLRRLRSSALRAAPQALLGLLDGVGEGVSCLPHLDPQ